MNSSTGCVIDSQAATSDGTASARDARAVAPSREFFRAAPELVIAKFEPMLGPWPASVHTSLVDVVEAIAGAS